MSDEIELRLLREIQELKEKLTKLEEKETKESIKKYVYSKIRDKELDEIVTIDKKISHSIFDDWFNYTENHPNEEFLHQLLLENMDFIRDYNEEDLKINFIAPILNKVNFKDIKKEIRTFYGESLTYETDRFILNGNCDFYVSKGLFKPRKPYFFIQEFKRNEDYSNPRPQLLAELIAAMELNKFQFMRGAFIVGSIWNFVILEKLGEYKYRYFVSINFDSTKIDDLKRIYQNLLFVKMEIFNLIEKESE